MSNVKISALPAATTPLTGTELVPLVQSGVTSQVAVSNINVGKLTSATGVVSVAAATAPSVGQVLTATSSTVATWQTPSSGASAATPTVLGTVYGITPAGGAAVALGYQAATTTTSATGVTAIGYQALQANTVTNNTAIGATALKATTTGASNTAVGFGTLLVNTTGVANIAIGSNALSSNVTSNYNVAIGINAGSSSTAVGNIYLGQGAGSNVTTGEYNILIGLDCSASAAGDTGEIVLGTSNSTAGITGKGSSTGFISPAGGGVYQGNNSLSWSITSDQRLKKNIANNNIGLEKITAIQVRNFEYRLPEEVDAELKPTDAIKKEGVQLGVIAQELQLILPDCVKTESTGVMSVNADNLTWYMVNAIKELKAEFDAYKLAHP